MSFFYCVLCASSIVAVTSVKDIQEGMDVPRYFLSKTADIREQKSLYYYVVDYYARYQKLDISIQLIKTLPQELKMIQKSLYISAFLSYYKEFGLDALMDYIQTLSPSIKPYVLEQLIVEVLKKKDSAEINYLLDSIKGTLIYSRVAQHVVPFYLENKDYDNATALVDTITLRAQRDEAFLLMIESVAEFESEADILAGIETISSQKVVEKAYKQVGLIFAKRKLFNEALNFANLCKIQDNYETVLVEIIRAFVDVGKLENAFEVAETLSIESKRQQALIALGVGFVTSGDIESVNRVSDQLTNPGSQADFVEKASIAFMYKGDIEEGFNMILNLDKNQREEPLKQFSYELANEGNFHYNLLLLQKIPDEDLLNESLAWFAIGLAEKEYISKALQVVRLIQDPIVYRECILYILAHATKQKVKERFVDLLENNQLQTDYMLDLLSNKSELNNDEYQLLLQLVTKKSLLDEDRITLRLHLLNRYYAKYTHSKAKKQLKLLKNDLKKIEYNVNFDLYSQFLQYILVYQSPKKCIKYIQKYPIVEEQLYFFDLFDDVQSTKKSTKKALQTFAKAYKK